MTTMAASEKDVGRLEGQVEALAERLDKLEPKIDTLLAFMSGNQGAWKALSIVASASAAAGALFSWLLEHGLKGFFK